MTEKGFFSCIKKFGMKALSVVYVAITIVVGSTYVFISGKF